MKKYHNILGVILCWAFAATANATVVPLETTIWAELNEKEQAALQAGQQVVHVQDIKGANWPRVTVFQATVHTPSELAGIYNDPDTHKNFIPNMVLSDTTRRESPLIVTVDYQLHINFFINIYYSTRNVLTSYDEGKSFRMVQSMTESEDLDNMETELRMEPLGTGAVFRFDMFVNPRSSMSASYKDTAISSTRDGAQALIDYVTFVKRDYPDFMAAKLEDLRKAFTGPAVSQGEQDSDDERCWLFFRCRRR